ncbi:MAG TPA: phosphate ABC transporter permease PstA [Anaerolineales bacterium]|nr:phosphate ABC transporter permease PstA [Anaerolineales bacterium]
MNPSQLSIPPGTAGPEFQPNLPGRHRSSRIWRKVFQISTIIGLIALTLLLFNVSNSAFGYVAYKFRVDPATLALDGVVLEDMDHTQLTMVLSQNISANAYKGLDRDKPIATRSESELRTLIAQRITRPEVLGVWSLSDSIFNRSKVEAEAIAIDPDATLVFKSWLTADFIQAPQAADPLWAGVWYAINGSLWTILICIVVAFPLGISAAIYLEEYSTDSWMQRIIQTNINNLAGVPSIIYGILGLALFVRALEPLTSGAIFSLTDATTANGRTILSAGLTLALLILPVIIINSQEAIRAVPGSLREASYGLGATRWQTVWSHVLPNAIPGILTGTILSVSRAIGETAPLVVVGASTYLTFNPDGPFSKFTTLPIQIYQWTSRPQAEFRSAAGAAILVLLVLLLSLNAAAILLRNRYSRRLQ